ncbi:serine/threonine-protein kinase 16 isoform X2 [Vigna umbellata]|uniref:serine/threonine-protein kinase 16 isoform X2 n=1 Tax=Vigna umbellata TaxID=87088 RepID=UPI001F5E881F|nr:serine/threonine-protein kinase 16 isoform X2 [Vigna umbellata]
MGCSFSGLNALYDSVNSGGDAWINENRFRIVRQLGEGGFAYVYLVKELINDSAAGGLAKKLKDSSHLSEDGTYAMKKVLIQNNEQLELVREEIRVSSLFNHPNLLPLLDHAIISVKPTQETSWNHEAYLLFPVHMDGTLLDNAKVMKTKKEFYSTSDVLQIFRQEWAAEHCSAPFRAPELWDCPSQASIDERTDVWSLGCTLYAIMYGVSPFEYALGESGGSLQLAIVNAQVKWPAGPKPPYPEAFHQFVSWMLQPQAAMRPRIDDIIIHVDKLIAKFTQ